MLIEIPPVSFIDIQPEPGAVGQVYALRLHSDSKLYITQSIPRLAREVLFGLCGSDVNISSLYPSVAQPLKQHRARNYSLLSAGLQQVNEVLKVYGGATIVVGQAELWSFDLQSVSVEGP